MIHVYGYETTAEQQWQWKTEALEANPFHMPLRPPKIPNRLNRKRNWALAVTDRRITAWAEARPINCSALTTWPARCSLFWYQVSLQRAGYFAVYHLHSTKLQTSGFNIVNKYTIPTFLFRNIATCLYGPGFESRHRQETFLFSQHGLNYRGVNLTTHLYIAPRLKIIAAIPLRPCPGTLDFYT
jgi:hypothetical protein